MTPEKLKELQEVLDEVELLTAEERKADAQLAQISQKLKERERKAYEIQWGIVPGKSLVSRKGKVFKVGGIISYGFDIAQKPWLSGHMRKKDGTFSSQRRVLYCDWELLSHSE